MSTLRLEYSRGEKIADKYEVIDLLDESPLGFTYRARHLESEKYVRLTMMRPSIAGREQKEQIIGAFKKARSLSHANLLKVGELGEHDGVAYYTTTDFDGGSLRQLLQDYKVESREFGVREAAQITLQLLEGLHELHIAGITMRALRPENVVIKARRTGPRQQNLVVEAKLTHACFWDLVPTATLVEDEFTRGEAQYLAPELKSFEPREGPRADLYSAGVIFYEMLVGQAPVGTFQLPSSRRPDVPTSVNDVTELGLANAPEDRYQSARDFIAGIQRTFQADAADDAEVKPVISRAGWALALLLVVFIAVILFNLRSDPEKEAEAADSQVRALVAEQTVMPSQSEVQAIVSKHPQNMLYVPGGPFVRGRLHSEGAKQASQSEPLAEVIELEPFLIDAFEHENLMNALPVYNANWTDANRQCEEAGKRLCSADEWEKACKGPNNTVYAYGDTFDAEFCGDGLDTLYKSGGKGDCKSGWGVFDQSGNFREWTSSTDKKGRHIVKGGMKSNAAKGTRCATTRDESSAYKDKSLSFRCCRDVDAPPVEDKPAEEAPE